MPGDGAVNENCEKTTLLARALFGRTHARASTAILLRFYEFGWLRASPSSTAAATVRAECPFVSLTRSEPGSARWRSCEQKCECSREQIQAENVLVRAMLHYPCLYGCAMRAPPRTAHMRACGARACVRLLSLRP